MTDGEIRFGKVAISERQAEQLTDEELRQVLVEAGASRLTADRIIAIERGAAEPSRARRHAVRR